MSRKVPFLFLLLALLLAVVLSGGDSREAPESGGVGVGGSSSDLHSVPGAHHGLASASWRTDARNEDDESGGLSTEPPSIPPKYTVDDLSENPVPEGVGEKLARSYVGLDIAVARPPREEEGTVRK